MLSCGVAWFCRGVVWGGVGVRAGGAIECGGREG